MNCNDCQQQISMIADGEAMITPKVKNHLQQCLLCKSFSESIEKMNQNLQNVQYPFAMNSIEDKVIQAVKPQRRLWLRMVGAIVIFVFGGICATVINVSTDQHGKNVYDKNTNIHLQMVTTQNAAQKLHYKRLKSLGENIETSLLASYQLAQISYYEDNDHLNTLAQIAEILELLECDHEQKMANVIEETLQISQDLYFSLSADSSLTPITRHMIKSLRKIRAKYVILSKDVKSF